MNFSISGFPVLHCLPKFAQVHVHCIGDAIHPSHPLTPFSPFTLNLSQHQGLSPDVMLFTSGNQSFSISPSNECRVYTSPNDPPFSLQRISKFIEKRNKMYNKPPCTHYLASTITSHCPSFSSTTPSTPYFLHSVQFSSVQLLSHVRLFETP